MRSLDNRTGSWRIWITSNEIPRHGPHAVRQAEARDEREYSKRMLAAIELGRKADAAFEQWLEEADATWLAAEGGGDG